MKRFIFALLIVCLLIGVPLIVMSGLSDKNRTVFVKSGEFNIPVGYKRIVVDLDKKVRDKESIAVISIKKPCLIDFYVQTDSEGYKQLQFTSNKKLIGTKDNIQNILNGCGKLVNGSNNTPSFILKSGKYSIVVSNEKASGKIMAFYKLKELSQADYKRLRKIDSGDINNPPKGYKKVYSTDFKSKNGMDQSIYKFSLDKSQPVYFSTYANVRSGNLNLRLVGTNYSSDMIYGSYYISDQCYRYLNKGDYEITLTSENVDGELCVFMKK